MFRAWGRVGTTIGGNKLENFGAKRTALEKFMELFAEKTGNLWEDRKSFQKRPNKFYPLDIDYSAVRVEVLVIKVRPSWRRSFSPSQHSRNCATQAQQEQQYTTFKTVKQVLHEIQFVYGIYLWHGAQLVFSS